METGSKTIRRTLPTQFGDSKFERALLNTVASAAESTKALMAGNFALNVAM